jgi:hypothetical protein
MKNLMVIGLIGLLAGCVDLGAGYRQTMADLDLNNPNSKANQQIVADAKAHQAYCNIDTSTTDFCKAEATVQQEVAIASR